MKSTMLKCQQLSTWVLVLLRRVPPGAGFRKGVSGVSVKERVEASRLCS
jgi:hypothetical protein